MQNRQLRVSVIIPVYNCETYVGRAVQSVLDQEYPAAEVIVVNDGSTDKTVGSLEVYRERIRLIHQSNAGVATARNTGLRQAQGDYIAFLDADDLWEPTRLKVQLAALEKFPDAGMVFSDFSVVDADGQAVMPSGIRWKYRAVRDAGVMSWDRVFSEARPIAGQFQGADGPIVHAYSGFVLQSLFLGNFINTSSVILRREVVERIGDFDRTLDTEEDYEYWLRVSAEVPLIYVDAPLVVFRKNPGQLTRADQIERIVFNALRVAEMASTRYLDRLTPLDIRRRLAQLHLTLGVIALRNGRSLDAQEQLVNSLRYCPCRMLTLAMYGVAWLPSGTLSLIDRLWRRNRVGGGADTAAVAFLIQGRKSP